MNPLREKLAALQHEQWSGWTTHMLDNLTPANIERWRRQCATAYEDLSPGEKDSDRKEADRVLDLLGILVADAASESE